jgi:hypothetical protein
MQGTFYLLLLALAVAALLLACLGIGIAWVVVGAIRERRARDRLLARLEGQSKGPIPGPESGDWHDRF